MISSFDSSCWLSLLNWCSLASTSCWRSCKLDCTGPFLAEKLVNKQSFKFCHNVILTGILHVFSQSYPSKLLSGHSSGMHLPFPIIDYHDLSSIMYCGLQAINLKSLICYGICSNTLNSPNCRHFGTQASVGSFIQRASIIRVLGLYHLQFVLQSLI